MVQRGPCSVLLRARLLIYSPSSMSLVSTALYLRLSTYLQSRTPLGLTIRDRALYCRQCGPPPPASQSPT